MIGLQKTNMCKRFYSYYGFSRGAFGSIELSYAGRKKDSFLIFNLGTGKGHSVLELVKTFEKVNNIHINYRFSDRRLGDKAIVYSNCDLAREVLKWEPKRTISDMCKDGWNWIIRNPNI